MFIYKYLYFINIVNIIFIGNLNKIWLKRIIKWNEKLINIFVFARKIIYNFYLFTINLDKIRLLEIKYNFYFYFYLNKKFKSERCQLRVTHLILPFTLFHSCNHFYQTLASLPHYQCIFSNWLTFISFPKLFLFENSSFFNGLMESLMTRSFKNFQIQNPVYFSFRFYFYSRVNIFRKI